MKYSQDIKQEALSRYKCGSDSVKNIIEDLNVPRSTLYYWIKQEAVLPSCRYAKQPAVSQKKYEDLRRHTAKLEQYVSAAKDINLSSLLTLAKNWNYTTYTKANTALKFYAKCWEYPVVHIRSES